MLKSWKVFIKYINYIFIKIYQLYNDKSIILIFNIIE